MGNINGERLISTKLQRTIRNLRYEEYC